MNYSLSLHFISLLLQLYTIIIMEVPKLDTDQAIIERRFNDFNNLHKGIRKECPNAIKEAQFPKKELFGNYNSNLLEARGRMFEKYLRYIFHQQGVRWIVSEPLQYTRLL